MNQLVSFLFWLTGVLQLISMIGGLIVWTVLIWMAFTRRGRYVLQQLWGMPEYRCRSCHLSGCCMAEDSGVLYPCRWYEECK